jgi:glucosamine-6-phosphate deaminase
LKQVIAQSKDELGKLAAEAGAKTIRDTIKKRGSANIIVATGASQFEMLSHLVKEPDIAWHKVTAFHLDEYVGMPITHGASFRGYLWKRFVSQLPLPLKAFNYVEGDNDPVAECKRLGELIKKHPIDLAFVGIGENGHLAFNDPPANFEIEDPYIVVDLDDACRRQQLGEGWFPTFEDVPKRAISMSCKHIMKSAQIICSVPDKRKAEAVKNSVEAPISPQFPATILQQHKDTTLFLDKESASLLKNK